MGEMDGVLDVMSVDELIEFLLPKQIDYDESSDWVVSTIRLMGVMGYGYEYETAIQHQKFNDADFIAVERYSTEKNARLGHKEWLKLMESDDFDELYSVDLDETFTRNKRIQIHL